MKIYNIKSSTVVIESNGVKVLCDPWLFDGEYYGSWFHYPPLEIRDDFFRDIDFIYVSHIHPDHFSKKSFAYLNSEIPVLIHRYESPFLRLNLERLGFNVIEIPNNDEYVLEDDFKIKIIAADNCNPELCGLYFGCGIVESKYGSTQIDSLAVFSDKNHVIVNTNDCPYDLTKSALDSIIKEYRKVDFLLVGYAGAGPYPQCFDMPVNMKEQEANKKKDQFINQAVSFIEHLLPEFFMPFAGTYILGGQLSSLNNFRGIPEIHEALGLIEAKLSENEAIGVLLNDYQYFDLLSKRESRTYLPIVPEERQNYIENILKDVSFDYESDPQPSLDEMLELLDPSFNRFLSKRKSIGFSSSTIVIIDLCQNKRVQFSCSSEHFDIFDVSEPYPDVSFVKYTLDPRLLFKILQGPRFAHWNNAEIGSHISFMRNPNTFERGLYYSMNFFHA